MVIKRLWDEFKYVYTNPYTLKWSIWFALFQAGHNQEGTYSQPLWVHIDEGEQNSILKFTGVTESVYTIFGTYRERERGAYLSVNCMYVELNLCSYRMRERRLPLISGSF